MVSVQTFKLNMLAFAKCGQCGKSLDEGKKTCGASFVMCNKCKMLIHPHCMEGKQVNAQSEVKLDEDEIKRLDEISNWVVDYEAIK